MVFRQGVRTTFLSTNRPALAASTPVSSAPAMGCAGTTCARCEGRYLRTAATKSILVLPASVTNVWAVHGASQSGQHALVLLDRHRQQYDVGIPACSGNIITGFVDDPQFERALDVGAPASDPHDVPHPSGPPERGRNRAADQADPEYNQFVAAEFAQERCATTAGSAHRTHFSTTASAARKRSFSDSVPIVTRRYSGMP